MQKERWQAFGTDELWELLDSLLLRAYKMRERNETVPPAVFPLVAEIYSELENRTCPLEDQA